MILRRALIRRSRLTQPWRSASRSVTTVSESDVSPGQNLPDQSAAPETPHERPIEGAPFSLQADVEYFRRAKKSAGKLGAIVPHHYQPHRIVNNPPQPKNVTLELLLAAGAHLGHATSLWNPGNQRYIFGIRQGIHIISLEQTAAHLRRAAKVVEGVSGNGGLILFVGTRAGQDRAVVQAARMSGGCHLFEKWVPGTITNGKMIVGHGKVLEKDEADRVDPESDSGGVEGAAPLRPDLVVCLNPLENYVMLHECGLFGIPTVGVVDTDADPTWVTYPIPANDDSLRCTQIIAGVLGRAGEAGRLARIKKANTVS